MNTWETLNGVEERVIACTVPSPRTHAGQGVKRRRNMQSRRVLSVVAASIVVIVRLSRSNDDDDGRQSAECAAATGHSGSSAGDSDSEAWRRSRLLWQWADSRSTL